MSGTLEQALIGNYGEDQNSALFSIKEEAKSDFLKKGLPKNREEEYKFTPITKVLNKNFSFTEKNQNGHVSEADLSTFLIDDQAAYRLIFINGHFSKDLSIIADNQGITVTNMDSAIKESRDHVVKYFGRLNDEDSFTALNTALTKDGTFIEISKNVKIDDPVYIYFINDSSDVESNSFPRNLIIANQGSESTVIEKTITIGKHNAFANTLTEVFVSENAKVNHIRIQNDVSNAFEVTQSKVYQESNSTYSAFTATLSGGMIRNNINIISDGQNCESNMFGLYLLDDKTHVDNHTTVDHKQPNSYSNELYKGVLDGKSKGVFNGKIFVRQEAQKTNAFQSNNNILLSDSATLNTKPQLEIWADDVKCSHGCTSGQLDEEAIFYLQARGISKENAVGMLLYAFANDVVDKIPVEKVKSYLDELVNNRLNS